MGRWQPDAQRRLREAAIELYREQGFEQATVADIASRAGVTERTFFRYFADKREVLFGGSEALLEAAVEAVRTAPDSATPLEAVLLGVEAAGASLPGAEYGRVRQSVIDANPSLQERELLKMASLQTAVAGALVERGTDVALAPLVASLGVSAFSVAYGRWIAPGETRDYPAVVREALAQLRAAAAG